MRASLQKLAESGQAFGTLFVGGAGQGGHLPELRRIAARRTILVEPVPGFAESISRAIEPQSGEELWSLALVPEGDGDATLHVVDQAQHSSLREPVGLFDYFPRLQRQGGVVVDSRSLSAAVDQLAIRKSESNLLVLDVPGMAHDLVVSLDDQRLRLFSVVLVRGSEEALYDGEHLVGAAVERLKEAGFDVVQDDPGEVYPYRAVLLERSQSAHAADDMPEPTPAPPPRPAAEEVVELQARLVSLQREFDEQKRLSDESNGALAYERDALSRTLGETETHLQHVAAESEQRVKRIADLEKEVHRLRDEKHCLDAEVLAAGRALSAETAALEAARATSAEIESRLAATASERDAAMEQARELGERLKAAEAADKARQVEIQSLRSRVGELNRGVAEAMASAGLSVRLQTLRENDLGDLQRRYASLSDAHEKQQDLLEKLSTRLIAANEYFQRLARSSLDEAPLPKRETLAIEQPAPSAGAKKKAGTPAKKSRPAAKGPGRKG